MIGGKKSANCDLCGYLNQSILSCRAGYIYSQHFTRRLHLRNNTPN
jgi:hypothetical protein